MGLMRVSDSAGASGAPLPGSYTGGCSLTALGHEGSMSPLDGLSQGHSLVC